MELYQLEYFNALCYHRSYTKAAQAFDVTQPSITAAVKKLEKELGGPLVRCIGKSFEITPLGEIVLRHATMIHDEILALREEAGELTDRRPAPIMLGVPMTLCPELVNLVMTDYLPRHREAPILLYQGAVETVAKQVEHGMLDMGIVSSNLIPENLEAHHLVSVEFCAFFSPESALSGEKQVTPEQLRRHPLIINDPAEGIMALVRDHLNANGGGNKMTCIGNMLPDNAFQVSQLTENVAFLSREQFGREGACFAPLSPPLNIDLFLVHRKSKTQSPAQRDLIRYILNIYKKNRG